MQMNIMQLIKEGKIGDSLATRGGDRHKHLRYVFIKMKKNQPKRTQQLSSVCKIAIT